MFPFKFAINPSTPPKRRPLPQKRSEKYHPIATPVVRRTLKTLNASLEASQGGCVSTRRGFLASPKSRVSLLGLQRLIEGMNRASNCCTNDMHVRFRQMIEIRPLFVGGFFKRNPATFLWCLRGTLQHLWYSSLRKNHSTFISLGKFGDWRDRWRKMVNIMLYPDCWWDLEIESATFESWVY